LGKTAYTGEASGVVVRPLPRIGQHSVGRGDQSLNLARVVGRDRLLGIVQGGFDLLAQLWSQLVAEIGQGAFRLIAQGLGVVEGYRDLVAGSVFLGVG
jgi:hypothetical protein